ncbi:phytanoyl-CoA dioxygenase family protein [Streptomyces sp. H27-D2]|uniref:phytanoyl-CoA dioxygenase family protein n=1 Tax=Streptomyces sp. H27-D2 TaxID=3046304 RepID=UPI002DBEFCEB|nr:phytanoyl-CoA dioxygenase family protein [Streptomyces sp. H27-D2]MEC4016374.1 phytanoyl-CoA dioxygenase family protein [Streptomyces sp. H27-D2]
MLSASLLEEYAEQGYVIAKGVIDPDTVLEPVIDEYGGAVDRLAEQGLRDETIADYDATAAPVDRLLHLMRETHGACFQSLDITLPMEDDILPDTPMHLGAAVFHLLRDEALLDAVESFIGPEILSNPVQHMRIKPPERNISAKNKAHTLTLTGKTFWHQDLAVVTDDADRTNLVSAWIPLNEATEENGCLLVVPGSHKGGLLHHCDTPSSQGIPDRLLGDHKVPLPVSPGDVILLHPLLAHASLPNVSDGGRWSFDLRYSPVGQPTGRRWYPEFVARSRAHPETETRDPQEWAASWLAARRDLAGRDRPRFHRWDPADPLCA